MSDRETGRIASANADEYSSEAIARDDASDAMMDETELSSEELDGVGGGRSYAKTDEDQNPDGRAIRP